MGELADYYRAERDGLQRELDAMRTRFARAETLAERARSALLERRAERQATAAAIDALRIEWGMG